MDTWTRRLFRLMFRLMAYRPPRVAVPGPGVTLEGVTVVNPGRGRQEGQTLVVEGGRIVRLVPAGAPRASPRWGGYVLPGLVDMHVHIPPAERALAGLLFLLHGVTAVRETGDADGGTWAMRRQTQAGRFPGPRIFASGPVLDGDPPFLPTSWAVRDAAEGQAAVERLAALGADLVKVQHMLSPEALVGIRQAAAEHGLLLAGHVPISVPLERAGIQDVQHLDGLVPYPGEGESPLDYNRRWRDLPSEYLASYVQVSAEQGLYHTPTLTASLSLTEPRLREEPAVQYMPRYYREVAWNTRERLPHLRLMNEQVLALMRQGFERAKELVRRLHRAGVRLHLGTDAVGMPFLAPGASLQWELGLLVDAGLSLEQAWAAGTRAAGETLGLPLLGTVQAGAPADLLLFERDPTADMAALSTLRAVVAQGRLYSVSFLQEALGRHRRRFEDPLYDRLTTTLIRQGMRRALINITPQV